MPMCGASAAHPAVRGAFVAAPLFNDGYRTPFSPAFPCCSTCLFSHAVAASSTIFQTFFWLVLYLACYIFLLSKDNNLC